MVLPTPFNTPEGMPTGTLATDSPATLNLARGKRYHAIWNEFGDSGALSTGLNFALAADIKTYLNSLIVLINVKLGTKIIRTMTGHELYAEYAKYGSQYGIKTSGTAGTAAFRVFLPIWFAEPWRNSNRDVATSALNVVGVESFQIEVMFKSAAISPAWTGWTETDALAVDERGNTVTNPGLIQKWLRKGLGASGTFNTFDKWDLKGWLQEITLYPTTDGKYVNKLRATMDEKPVRGFLTVTENQAKLLSRNMFPDTAAVPRFEWVIDYSDPVHDWLPWGGAEAFEVYVEYNASAAGGMTALIKTIQPL